MAFILSPSGAADESRYALFLKSHWQSTSILPFHISRAERTPAPAASRSVQRHRNLLQTYALRQRIAARKGCSKGVGSSLLPMVCQFVQISYNRKILFF